ncbi:hypothetical protein C8Q80DRAFT_201132 [Daedaleopsis nitida]|nr:hypothetical protein C8Q80DRAFT_201132 [Daedaleopsis nitida]
MASQVGILHRDVSGGNILIYPIIDETVDDATGITTRDLRWAGILTDWELSKKLDGPHIARQPERTGTWQFMSVAILTNRYKVVEVTDDLESFLYVLLYHAIRYLQSNCINVGDWIEEFFDCFTVTTAGSYSCGEKKFLTITVSARLTAPSVGNISLSPPMDYLLSELLRSFRAYYAVKAYDARKKLYSYAPTTDPAPSTSLGSKLPPPRRRKRPVPVKAIAESEKVEYVPTQAERDLAGNVAEHSGMITLLLNALEMDGWGDKDKVRDRIPDDWQPKKPLGPSVMSSVGKSKKRRLQGPGSMPSL